MLTTPSCLPKATPLLAYPKHPLIQGCMKLCRRLQQSRWKRWSSRALTTAPLTAARTFHQGDSLISFGDFWGASSGVFLRELNRVVLARLILSSLMRCRSLLGCCTVAAKCLSILGRRGGQGIGVRHAAMPCVRGSIRCPTFPGSWDMGARTR